MTPTSYLGWPCTLKAPFDHVDAHVTFKYLGEGHFTVLDLATRLKDQQTKLILKPRADWKAEVFGSDTHVMLLEVDNSLLITRKRVEDLRQDDPSFIPWKAHITFKKSLWGHFNNRNLAMHQVIESFGSLTLFLDRKAVYTF